jgi:hypothetical protein
MSGADRKDTKSGAAPASAKPVFVTCLYMDISKSKSEQKTVQVPLPLGRCFCIDLLSVYRLKAVTLFHITVR